MEYDAAWCQCPACDRQIIPKCVKRNNVSTTTVASLISINSLMCLALHIVRCPFSHLLLAAPALSASDPPHLSPSMATLAAFYNFPPPPHPTIFEESGSSGLEFYHNYSSGIMMVVALLTRSAPNLSNVQHIPFLSHLSCISQSLAGRTAAVHGVRLSTVSPHHAKSGIH
ncbi:hypothetical protein APHAL10511_002807 [Amanita phalloides]|nr:hypothetical protein APHAL10511_002807 [Amanita phalloides]